MDEVARPRLIEIARRFEPLIIEGASYAYLVENPPPPFAALAPDITICVVGTVQQRARGGVWRLPSSDLATVRS